VVLDLKEIDDQSLTLPRWFIARSSGGHCETEMISGAIRARLFELLIVFDLSRKNSLSTLIYLVIESNKLKNIM